MWRWAKERECMCVSGVSLFYSENYFDARSKFRSAVKELEDSVDDLVEVPIRSDFAVEKGGSLSQDIAVIRGQSDRVLIHLSGTHGVEGFAGSAIQIAILNRLREGIPVGKDLKSGPTILLVHAVNPYGFAAVCQEQTSAPYQTYEWYLCIVLPLSYCATDVLLSQMYSFEGQMRAMSTSIVITSQMKRGRKSLLPIQTLLAM